MKGWVEEWMHTIWLLQQQHLQEEYWCFLLIDGQNVFNEYNCVAMLWAVQFKWYSDMKFSFNVYYHY